MSNLMADQLHEWVETLSDDLETLERTWVEIRRMRWSERYLERADQLEEALDLIRFVRTQLVFEAYGERRKAEKEVKAA